MLPYMAEYACYRPPITGGRGPVGCLSTRRPLQITLSVRSSNHLAFYALSCNILAKLAYMRFLTQYIYFFFHWGLMDHIGELRSQKQFGTNNGINNGDRRENCISHSVISTDIRLPSVIEFYFNPLQRSTLP